MYVGTNTSEGIPIYGVFVILLIIKSFLCYACLKKNPMFKFWLIVCVLFISLSLTNVYMVGFGTGDGVDFTDRSRSRSSRHRQSTVDQGSLCVAIITSAQGTRAELRGAQK